MRPSSSTLSLMLSSSTQSLSMVQISLLFFPFVFFFILFFYLFFLLFFLPSFLTRTPLRRCLGLVYPVPQLTAALALFVGTLETQIGTPTLGTDSFISQQSFRRVVLCVTSHSSLTESLLAYTSISTVSRDNKDAEMRTTLKTLPPYVIFHLEVTLPSLPPQPLAFQPTTFLFF